VIFAIINEIINKDLRISVRSQEEI